MIFICEYHKERELLLPGKLPDPVFRIFGVRHGMPRIQPHTPCSLPSGSAKPRSLAIISNHSSSLSCPQSDLLLSLIIHLYTQQSQMAEILAVVASGMGVASLAIQVASSVKKLKDFCDRAKDTPSEIRDTLDDIETLPFVIDEIEAIARSGDHLSQGLHAALLRSAKRCREASNELRSIVSEVETAIQKHKFRGAVKGTLKKSRLDEIRQRLESAKMTCVLVNQSHQRYPSLRSLQLIRHGLANMVYPDNRTSILAHLSCFCNNRTKNTPNPHLLPRVLKNVLLLNMLQ